MSAAPGCPTHGGMHTCEELGVCQQRAPRCAGCTLLSAAQVAAAQHPLLLEPLPDYELQLATPKEQIALLIGSAVAGGVAVGLLLIYVNAWGLFR